VPAPQRPGVIDDHQGARRLVVAVHQGELILAIRGIRLRAVHLLIKPRMSLKE